MLCVLLLQYPHRGLVTVDDLLRQKPLLQCIVDANHVLFAGTDHPMAKSATADWHAGALEGLCQAIERCAVDIFMNKSKGQRRYCPARAVRASAR